MLYLNALTNPKGSTVTTAAVLPFEVVFKE